MAATYDAPTLRDRFPIFCRTCKKKILSTSYHVVGILIQDNGIPVSLYCHRNCLSDVDGLERVYRPIFEGVAHCVYCGEPTQSNDFECEACKQQVKRDLRKNGDLSEAAREFISALAQIRHEQIVAQRSQDEARHQARQREYQNSTPQVDPRDLETAQARNMPLVTVDDFGPFVPTNESGVVYVTGSIAKDLGYRASYVGNSYPDALFISPSQKLLRVEFEFSSGNFITHGHDPSMCDMVICWKKDRELPLPVLELSRYYDAGNGKWDFRRVSEGV